MKQLGLFISILLLITACNVDEDLPELIQQERILGNWNVEEIQVRTEQDSTIEFSRNLSIEFSENGSFRYVQLGTNTIQSGYWVFKEDNSAVFLITEFLNSSGDFVITEQMQILTNENDLQVWENEMTYMMNGNEETNIKTWTLERQ